eukprot:jgi/Tetstr1/423422/TSEL_014103.t1
MSLVPERLRGKLLVAGLVGTLVAAIGAVAVYPVLGGGGGRVARDRVEGGLQRKGVWANVDKAAKSEGHALGSAATRGIAGGQCHPAGSSAACRHGRSTRLVAAARPPELLRHMSEGAKGVTPADLHKAQRLSLGAGLAAGLFGSVVGVGGGVVIVPMIANACRSIPQRLISGTSLVAVVSTGIFSSLTTKLNCQALRRVLGYFLVAVSPLVPLKTFITEQRAAVAGEAGTESASQPLGDFEWPSNQRAAALLVVGSVAGFLSGLLGIGGGVVVTPLLALTSGMEQAQCVGTSLCAMIPPALVGVAQHYRLGNVNWRMGAALAVGTAAGGTAGSMLALQAPEGALELAFAGAMLFLGIKMLKKH